MIVQHRAKYTDTLQTTGTTHNELACVHKQMLMYMIQLLVALVIARDYQTMSPASPTPLTSPIYTLTCQLTEL